MRYQTISQIQERSKSGEFKMMTEEAKKLPSMTNLENADSADVNKIIEKFILSGTVDNIAQGEAMENVQLSTQTDYHETHRVLQNARRSFMKLGEEVRTKFHNDPIEMLEFMKDPKNIEECHRLGLTKRRDDEGGRFIKKLAKALTPKKEEKVGSGQGNT